MIIFMPCFGFRASFGQTRWWLSLVLAVLGWGASCQVNACDYCVREVGFVPLHGEPYQVIIAVSEATTQSDRWRLRDQARAAVQPSNVIVRVGTPSEGERFADAADQITGPLPAAVVYAPDGRSAVIGSGSQLGDASATAARIAPVVHSPTREGLGDLLLHGFCRVVLVEGDDESANQAAREITEQAIERIDAVKAGFDRVIEVGPSLQVISAEDYEAERWLLWALGIEPKSQPHVAVLYGRGIRLGDVLAADQLTMKKLYTMLSFLARDCECDLDREWLYGRAIPLIWNDDLRQQAYSVLGFDPESAATRAEVARILARGMQGQGGQVRRDPFADAVTHTGIPGLMIHHLDAADSLLPPAPPQSAETPDSTPVPETVAAAVESAPSAIESPPESTPSLIVSDPNTAWQTTWWIVAAIATTVLLSSVVIVVRAKNLRAS